ncbi:MAG: porin [Cytophagaceae bacterium]
MRKLPLLIMAFLSVLTVLAQDTTKTESGKLTLSGYVDAYYTYNFNRPPHQPGLAWENEGRIFDIKHNEFSIGLAQLKADYTFKGLTGVIDLTFGPNAALGNFGNVLGGADIFIKQAYLTYNVTEKLQVTAGQFGTHIGYELIDAPLNFNYSLSYLFGNGPFYHTGARVGYSFSDKLGVMAGIVNGWDAMYDFNKKKSYIAQLYVSPAENWDVYINYIGGDEKNGLSFPTIGAPGSEIPDSIKTPSHLLDLTTGYQLTESFKVGLNAAYGFGTLKPSATATSGYESASWYGAALYLNYYLSEKFGLGLRAEHFNDKDGVRYVTGSFAGPLAALGKTGVVMNEITLTGDIRLAGGNFIVKPEFRIDIADSDVFGKYKSDGTPEKATNIMPTLGTALMYKF